jgi:Flp pilus assembly protein TadD
VDGALRHFMDAVRLDPDNAEAHNNLGIVQVRRGLVDEAIGHFRRATAVKPDFAFAHWNLGMALRQSSRNAEAVASLQRALQIDPENAAIAGLLEAWLRADRASGVK